MVERSSCEAGWLAGWLFFGCGAVGVGRAAVYTQGGGGSVGQLSRYQVCPILGLEDPPPPPEVEYLIVFSTNHSEPLSAGERSEVHGSPPPRSYTLHGLEPPIDAREAK